MTALNAAALEQRAASGLEDVLGSTPSLSALVLSVTSERCDEHREIVRSNGDKLRVHPDIVLDAITQRQATFTTRDLAMFVHRHSDGKDQFDAVMAATKTSPDLVALG